MERRGFFGCLVAAAVGPRIGGTPVAPQYLVSGYHNNSLAVVDEDSAVCFHPVKILDRPPEHFNCRCVINEPMEWKG